MERPDLRRSLVVRYLADLTAGRLLLWCYFLWYLVVAVRYFDPDHRLWLTSFGMSVIVGIALYISTTAGGAARGPLGFWPTARLFIMPLCVSSFAALAKGKGFILVFSTRMADVLWGAGLCAALMAAVITARCIAPDGLRRSAGR